MLRVRQYAQESESRLYSGARVTHQSANLNLIAFQLINFLHWGDLFSIGFLYIGRHLTVLYTSYSPVKVHIHSWLCAVFLFLCHVLNPLVQSMFDVPLML